MKLIDSSVTIIDIDNPFAKIEKVGRTCYKSDSDMTEETAKKFYNNLVNRKHFAMLEHVSFCFKVDPLLYDALYGYKFLNYSVEELKDGNMRFLISGNVRAINETQEVALLQCLYDIDPALVYFNSFTPSSRKIPIEVVDVDNIGDIQEHAYKKHKHLTFHFICDRGVSHEIVRHRPCSYAQESTRYCNYSKDKFGSEITYIKPANYDEWNKTDKHSFEVSLDVSEKGYLCLIKNGLTPQQARALLPNAVKTEVIMTANCEEFDHFFDLRSRGVTGAPHPDMKLLADKALELYENIIKKF